MCVCVLHSSLATKERRRGEKERMIRAKGKGEQRRLFARSRPRQEFFEGGGKQKCKDFISFHRLPLELVLDVERAQREQAEEDARRERAVGVVPAVFEIFEFFLKFRKSGSLFLFQTLGTTASSLPPPSSPR